MYDLAPDTYIKLISRRFLLLHITCELVPNVVHVIAPFFHFFLEYWNSYKISHIFENNELAPQVKKRLSQEQSLADSSEGRGEGEEEGGGRGDSISCMVIALCCSRCRLSTIPACIHEVSSAGKM